MGDRLKLFVAAVIVAAFFVQLLDLPPFFVDVVTSVGVGYILDGYEFITF